MNTHTGLKPYKCEICHESFTQAGKLSMHKKYVHYNKEKLRPIFKITKVIRPHKRLVNKAENQLPYKIIKPKVIKP